MARPIEKTPTLTGTDAKNFCKSLLDCLQPRMSEEEAAERKQELRRMKANYQSVVEATHGVFY
jgi:hypothetical protein